MNITEMVAAEMKAYSDGAYADHGSARDMLARFANSVSAAEREACANLCDIEATNCMEVDADAMPFLAIAEAIRRRSLSQGAKK